MNFSVPDELYVPFVLSTLAGFKNLRFAVETRLSAWAVLKEDEDRNKLAQTALDDVQDLRASGNELLEILEKESMGQEGGGKENVEKSFLEKNLEAGLLILEKFPESP